MYKKCFEFAQKKLKYNLNFQVIISKRKNKSTRSISNIQAISKTS